MIKKIFLIFVAALLMLDSETVFSQKKSKPKKAPVKTAKKPAPVNDEEAFQLKLQATLKESENWREHTFVKDNFRAMFPRQPILKEESFYDESLGKVQLSSYFSLGDNGLFVAAHFRLPFSITDEAVLRKLYQDVSKESLTDDETEITEVKEIQINGKPGLETIGVNKKKSSEKTILRIFLVNKDVFYNLVIPLPLENLSPQELIESQAKLEKETNDFFNSFVEVSNLVASTVQPVPLLFKSTFVDSVFKSEYFDFTIKIPQDWREISQDDVSGLRESGKEILQQNSKLKIPTSLNVRRNLFAFSAKPLGADKNQMFVCNVMKKPSPEATILELSNLLENALEQVKFYTITKKTHKLSLGKTEFVGLEIKGVLAEEEFQQAIYFYLRKDYALGFVFTYFSEEDKKLFIDSLSSLKFAAQ